MNTYSHSDMLKLLFIFALLLFFNAGTLIAQTPIGLEEAISMARQSNRSIQLADQSTKVQKAIFEQTKGQFLPYFGIEVTDIATNNPLNVFGFKLMQEEVRQADFDPAVLNNPDVRNQFQISANVMMPLLNLEARSEQDAVRSQIKMKESMAQRTMDGIELEVVKSYYMLLMAQKAVDVLEETYKAAEANYEIALNSYDQGLMLKSDLLDMQIMVNQSELTLGTAKTNEANAQSYFKHVLNTPETSDFIPIDFLMEVAEFMNIESSLNPERADFKAMHHGIEAMDHMVIAANKSFLPKISAFGGVALNDQVPFENRATNFQIGVTLGWDIYKGNSRKSSINKIKAEIEEKQLELEQKMDDAKLEILKTERAIEDIKSQIALHDLSIRQSNEALTIRKNRFEQGLEKSTDIINAETQLSQKKLARLNSLYELNVQNAYLKFLLK